MSLDETLTKLDDNFAQADSIIVTPIYLESDDVVSDLEWYQGLYYYQAVRLNQGDLLFHYVVTKTGQIFEGGSKGEEHRYRTTDDSLHPIIIGYMANKDDIQFDDSVKQNLAELILDIANRNSITMDRVFVKDMQLVAKPNSAIITRFGILGGKWERSLNTLINTIKDKYSPQPKQFDLKIEKVDLPVDAVNYGDNIVMNITLRNNSDYILLKGNPSEPIMTLATGNSSKFFQNGVWLGLSQTSIMPEAAFLRAHESKTFQVRLFVPLYFGIQKEKFSLTDTLGRKYVNSDFEVTLNVNHPKTKVVEILPKGSTILNVHDNPWYSSPTINRVSVGQRFVVIEETKEGWLNLNLGNGKSGWVIASYTRTI
jgi:hypothetical protein